MVSYSDELAARICAQIAGGRSLRSICADDDMPSAEAVRQWLKAMPDFAAQYAVARDEQADHYADEIIEIADTEHDANKARVRIDARKWVACKLKPKKYGDKVQTEVSGPDGAPLSIAVRLVTKDGG